MAYETYDAQTEAIISAGFKLLREHLGVLETEIFITKVTLQRHFFILTIDKASARL